MAGGSAISIRDVLKHARACLSRMRPHASACVRMRSRMRPHASACVRMRPHASACVVARVRMRSRMRPHARAHAYACVRPHARMRPHARARASGCVRARARACMRSCSLLATAASEKSRFNGFVLHFDDIYNGRLKDNALTKSLVESNHV